MASNHVSSDQVPLQSQSIYTDPSYQNLFSNADRYGTPSWEQQLHQQPNVAPSSAPTQTWQHGSFPQQPYNAFGQAYGSPAHGFQTSSPYQYGQFTQQSITNPYAQSGNGEPLSTDPNVLRQHQPSPYRMPMRTSTPQTQPGTVTPQALQQNAVHAQNVRPLASPFQMQRPATDQIVQRTPSASFVQPVPEPSYDIPKGRKSGGFYVLDPAALSKATQSTALNKLVTLGSIPYHLPTNRTALPLYTARQSVRELKKAGADNKKLLAKLSSSKPSVAKKLRTNTYAGSPSALKREVSDSDSYTDSSDDSSEYTDDEEEEISPLPPSRPEEPHGAVQYDIIKNAWFPSKTVLSAEKLKEVLSNMYDVLHTIRERWRADSKAVLEADENKKTGDLPVLKSRVASQRDLLQSGLKAVLEYAHPDVLYNFGQARSFLYLTYQFLANRQKAGDYTGSLPKAIFEVLSHCGTFASADFEATKLAKALALFKKHTNDEIKSLIQKIETTIAANDKKKAKAGSPSHTETSDGKAGKRGPPETSVNTAKDSVMAKKLKTSDTSALPAKTGSATAPSRATTAQPSLLKKAGERTAPSTAPIKARVSQINNKPSGLFASLNAASKKPTTPAAPSAAAKATIQSKPTPTAAKEKKPAAASAKPAFSFAQTMASLLKPKEPEAAPVKSEKQLPPETPEEKTRRMRKEARRHLRVTFKPDAALVQIKYFSHDPEEEMGHDENFVRDAGDIGGEGRMFKQHKELEVDDDDDESEIGTQDWKEPSQVDFTSVAHLTQGNYAPYGGGQQVVSSTEKEANIARENATLMVFYADPKDIPSSPREPLEQGQDSVSNVSVKMFGEPPESVRTKSIQSTVAPQAAPVASAGLDLSQLENIFKQFANPGTSVAPAPASEPPANPTPVPGLYAPSQVMADAPPADLQSILNALRTTVPQAQPPTQPPAFPAQAPLPPMPQAPFPADLSAIMSAFQAAGNGMALPPPPPGLPPGLPPGFPPFPMPFQLQQPDVNSYQPQQQQQYDNTANGSTKRPREDTSNDRGFGKKHKVRGERPHKVLPCRFFQKGTCNKGDNCTYVHDLNM